MAQIPWEVNEFIKFHKLRINLVRWPAYCLLIASWKLVIIWNRHSTINGTLKITRLCLVIFGFSRSFRGTAVRSYNKSYVTMKYRQGLCLFLLVLFLLVFSSNQSGNYGNKNKLQRLNCFVLYISMKSEACYNYCQALLHRQCHIWRHTRQLGKGRSLIHRYQWLYK